jgi:L-iditol 2-dehydrogenase
MRWEEVEVPLLGPHDVRIRVKYCGICGTDYAIYSGETSFYEAGLIHTPMTLGHEYSGVIDAVGEKVTKFQVGDRVVADTGVSCGICVDCLRGDYLQCRHMQAVGTIKCKDGAYAQYTTMPERHVFHLSDDVSFEEGALCEPIGTALYSVLRPKVGIADTVIIIGTGPIGLSAVSMAKLQGAGKIILCGRKEMKLRVGKKMGADYTINMTSENMADRVNELTEEKGANVIVEASGSEDMLHFALEHIEGNGRISVVAFYEKRVSGIDLDRLVLGNIDLVGSMGSPNMAPVVLKLLKEKKVDCMPMVTAVYPLEQAEQALIASKQKSAENIKILLKA